MVFRVEAKEPGRKVLIYVGDTAEAEDLHARVKAVAREKGVSMGTVVRQMLKHCLGELGR
jgi:hypothetical protein